MPPNPTVKYDNVYLLQQPSQQILTPETAYLMYNLLQDVVKRGTAKKAAELNRADIGGKTGSTNGLKDNWFCGLNGDFSATVWVGFDNLFSLKRYASQLALPIWNDIMRDLLDNQPQSTPTRPQNIITQRIDKSSGEVLHHANGNSIFELFDTSNIPYDLEATPDKKAQTLSSRSSVF